MIFVRIIIRKILREEIGEEGEEMRERRGDEEEERREMRGGRG